MELYPIMATGIKAFCSDMIIDPHFEEVYFMSVAGYQTTVKGIIANLFENYGLSVEINGNEHDLTRIENGRYKTQVKKLPSGLVHAVCTLTWHCQRMKKTNRTVFASSFKTQMAQETKTN